jgi:hypothetical protein
MTGQVREPGEGKGSEVVARVSAVRPILTVRADSYQHHGRWKCCGVEPISFETSRTERLNYHVDVFEKLAQQLGARLIVDVAGCAFG